MEFLGPLSWLLADTGGDTTFVALLVAALGSMGGFTLWMYRNTLARSDKRVDQLEAREAQTMNTVASSLEKIEAAMTSMALLARSVQQLQTTMAGILEAIKPIRERYIADAHRYREEQNSRERGREEWEWRERGRERDSGRGPGEGRD